MVSVTRFDREAAATTRRPEGSAMTVTVELDGQAFAALNGGPIYPFRKSAVSVRVTEAMLRMKKLDIATLKKGAEG